jgi:uncharacterized OB-fold protein
MTQSELKGHLPSPIINAENEPFWKAAQDDRLILKFCKDCSQYHYYPRTICPHCGSDNTEWKESSGDGLIYSYTVMRRGVEHPFAMAYITLSEGIKVLSHITDSDVDQLQIGQAVKLVFKPTQDGQKVALFKVVT